ANMSELDWMKGDCLFMLKHLDKFSKDEYLGAPHVPLMFSPTKVRIHKEPLGAVLIIGTYNYPFLLLLSPMIGAMAAGCTAVVKPSEGSPASAMVIQEMLQDRLDPAAFAVVNGAVPETTALLEEKWDKIMYTGNQAVAKIVSKKAAETLTPVCLELGGRNPAFITKGSDLYLAARRLLWSKTLNAGQVCLSLNYVIIDKAVVQPFIEQLNKAFKEFFPDGSKNSELAHIVNERHFLRMKKMIDDSKGRIVMGGQMDQSRLFIEPTAVLVDSPDDSMVEQESFGPLFAILPANNLSDAINMANRVDKTPLAMYTFGSKAENNRGLF
ncbi:MAG: aldehyde dehydrogenase family protein, partial [Thaumarchaeota archaeon]|nr:aldehyde dehydrogenase family protein [Nitrososphaerota archaeon]